MGCVAVAVDVAVVLFKEMLDQIIESHARENLLESADHVRQACIEIILNHSATAVDCIDGLIAHVLGGLEREEFSQSLGEFEEMLSELAKSGLDTKRLEKSVLEV